jgi:hypothetical protein
VHLFTVRQQTNAENEDEPWSYFVGEKKAIDVSDQRTVTAIAWIKVSAGKRAFCWSL